MNMASQDDKGSQWLARLKQVTEILRENRSASEEELNMALAELDDMKRLLKKQNKRKDFAPRKSPPILADVIPSAVRSLVPSSTDPRNQNPFATFQYLMDDDSSDDEDGEDDEEDHTSTNSPEADTPFPLRAEPSMDVRRLLIRIYDAQSSIHALLALCCRKRSAWLEGAGHFQICIQLIQSGLLLADSAISKFLSHIRNPKRLAILQEDANIIEVAVQSMARSRNAYIAAAQSQANYLVRKLTPQWKSRDDVKKRMGDRWYQNPKPRMDYAQMRADMEDQLKLVNAAIESLQTMDVETIAVTTKDLLERLAADAPDDETRRRRYNGQRPDDTSERVSWDDYPDPTEFGWTFTGSWAVAEFFERDGVKLDWYFTTATVKTSLDHPKQGKTQLFAAQVSPEVYLQILLEPRHHTGQRYHTRP